MQVSIKLDVLGRSESVHLTPNQGVTMRWKKTRKSVVLACLLISSLTFIGCESNDLSSRNNTVTDNNTDDNNNTVNNSTNPYGECGVVEDPPIAPPILIEREEGKPATKSVDFENYGDDGVCIFTESTYDKSPGSAVVTIDDVPFVKQKEFDANTKSIVTFVPHDKVGTGNHTISATAMGKIGTALKVTVKAAKAFVRDDSNGYELYMNYLKAELLDRPDAPVELAVLFHEDQTPSQLYELFKDWSGLKVVQINMRVTADGGFCMMGLHTDSTPSKETLEALLIEDAKDSDFKCDMRINSAVALGIDDRILVEYIRVSGHPIDFYDLWESNPEVVELVGRSNHPSATKP